MNHTRKTKRIKKPKMRDSNRHQDQTPPQKHLSKHVKTILLTTLTLATITHQATQIKPSDYTNGGEGWPDANCKLKDGQSPIHILAYQATCDESHTFEYKIKDKSNTIEIKRDPTAITFKSDFIEFFFINLQKEFLGFQSEIIKFRNPSEHIIDELKHFDIEMQIIGKLKPSFYSSVHKYAVLSILMTEVSEDQRKFKFQEASDYTKLLDLLKPWEFGSKTVALSEWFENEVGLQPTYFYYEGSLTEPPCAQNVSWIVLKNSFAITTVEKLKIANMFQNNVTFANGEGNNRKLKEKGDRVVIEGGKDCSHDFAYVIAFVFLYVLMMYFIFKLL